AAASRCPGRARVLPLRPRLGLRPAAGGARGARGRARPGAHRRRSGAGLLRSRHQPVPRTVPARRPHRGARPRAALRPAPAGAPPQGRDRAGARRPRHGGSGVRGSGPGRGRADRPRDRRGLPSAAGGAAYRSAMAALRRQVADTADAKVDRLRRDVDGRTAELLERSIRRILAKVMHDPAERARHLAETGFADAYVEAFHTIFGIDISSGARTGGGPAESGSVAGEPADGAPAAGAPLEGAPAEGASPAGWMRVDRTVP